MAAFSNLSELLDLYPNAFNSDAAKGMDGVVQLDISGEKGGTYFLEIADQSLDITEGTHADPTVTITTTDEHWLDIHRGESNPMTLMMRGELSISGSMAMATKFQDLFEV